ncbi:HNH endonuclease [Proteus mirabilis]|uniref:HNH endonuclease n=1 Tax=Proteus mirabilis TaxID=584 RepID=UPI0021BE4504|nr:HNH endonuclease [Proteus mirabilis]MCT9020921.1 HNH endonuclease [Proteus mirabilis]
MSHYSFTQMDCHDLLLSTLHYNPDTGIFTRIKHRGGMLSSSVNGAGSLKKSGYVDIRFNRKIFKAHRLAWYYVYKEWPSEEIDHINGIKSDNRIKNLREASRAENVRNIGRRNKNTSGYKGVSKNSKSERWVARITVKRKIINIGIFDKPEDAYDAYCKKSKELHGKFSNIDNNPPHLKGL